MTQGNPDEYFEYNTKAKLLERLKERAHSRIDEAEVSDLDTESDGFVDLTITVGYDIHEARENGFDEEEIEYLYGPQTPTRPQDEDYVLYPRGPLGSQTAVGIYNGAYVGTYPTDDDALLAIGTLMDLHGVYPNVWRNDDHGGWTLVLMNDDGTEYEEVEEPDVDDDFPIELEYNDNPGVNAPPIWDEDTYYEQR